MTQSISISHLQVEWMQHFIHKTEQLEEISYEGTYCIACILLIGMEHIFIMFMSMCPTESFERESKGGMDAFVNVCSVLSMHGAAAN